MKIGILTHYQAESHGACLQHYALTQFLRQQGHEVYTLCYNRDYSFSSEHDRKKFSLKLTSIPFYLKEYVLRQGVPCFLTMMRKHFILRHFNLRSFQFLPYNTDHLDAVIVGSDEVWSLQTGIDTMMFGHNIQADRIIAYAPCFGQTTVEEICAKECCERIRTGLAQFSALSARDPHTQAVVHQLIGQKPPLVCDPALLYDFHTVSYRKRRTRKPYVVVYAYSSNLNEPDRIREITEYARSIHADIYAIGGYHRWCDKQIICDPLEMLHWFRSASAVITDTFHGTISAFLTNTPMAVYVRPSNTTKLYHLLSMLNLEDREVRIDNTLQQVFDTPYSPSTPLSTLQKESTAWLKQALEQS